MGSTLMARKLLFACFLSVSLSSANYPQNSKSDSVSSAHPGLYQQVSLNLVASSTLSDTSENERRKLRYGPYNMLDGNPLTAWSEGKTDSGAGETLEFSFSEGIRFNEIRIMPGYFDPKYWKANNRVKQIRVRTHEDMPAFVAQFTDTMTEQSFFLPSEAETKHVELTIEDIFRGASWDDTCISGIGFYLNNQKIQLMLPPLIQFNSVSRMYKTVFTDKEKGIPVYFDGYFVSLKSDGTLVGGNAGASLVTETLAGKWNFDQSKAKVSLNMVFRKNVGFSVLGSDYADYAVELELDLLGLGCTEHITENESHFFRAKGPFYFAVSNRPGWADEK